MTDKKVFIHLGLPKTASTFLQEELFPKLDGVIYYPKHSYSLNLAEKKHAQPILLTCEKDAELMEELKLVHRKAPEANIILVFREPFSWLTSKYKYSIRKHGSKSFLEYVTEDLGNIQNIKPGFYSGIIELLKELFPGRYLILNFTELKKDRSGFIKRITDFTQTSLSGTPGSKIVKPAFQPKQLIRLLKLNKAYPYQASRSNSKAIRFIHYKYREFLLHIIAFISRLSSTDTAGFINSIEKNKTAIQSDWAYDWNSIKHHTGQE